MKMMNEKEIKKEINKSWYNIKHTKKVDQILTETIRMRTLMKVLKRLHIFENEDLKINAVVTPDEYEKLLEESRTTKKKNPDLVIEK